MDKVQQLTQEEAWEFIDIMTSLNKWRVKVRNALSPYEKDTFALLDQQFGVLFASMKNRAEQLEKDEQNGQVQG